MKGTLVDQLAVRFCVKVVRVVLYMYCSFEPGDKTGLRLSPIPNTYDTCTANMEQQDPKEL